MLGRAERAEAEVLTGNTFHDRLVLVSQANIKYMEGGRNGRKQLITYKMEMPVPYRVYPEISAKGIVWTIEDGCA